MKPLDIAASFLDSLVQDKRRTRSILRSPRNWLGFPNVRPGPCAVRSGHIRGTPGPCPAVGLDTNGRALEGPLLWLASHQCRDLKLGQAVLMEVACLGFPNGDR